MTASAFFLVGPTATGKSDVAQRLAEAMDADILSADAMLVYRGMDIGTAKPSLSSRGAVPYFGIDVVTPDQSFSVWDYWRYASSVLRERLAMGRRVIVVGGTGLYVKSLTHGLRQAPAPDDALRACWERRVAAEGIGVLQAEVARQAPEFYAAFPDKANPRRLVRALERLASGGGLAERWDAAPPPSPLVGLAMPPDVLKSRIVSRVDAIYAAKFIDEVRDLASRFVLSPTASQAIGYAEARAVVEGRLPEAEARCETVRRTVQLARRQRTWFRHQASVTWIECGAGDPPDAVGRRVREAWDRQGPSGLRLGE